MFFPVLNTAFPPKHQWITDGKLWFKGIFAHTRINISESLILFTFAYSWSSFSYRGKATKKKGFLALLSISHIINWVNTLQCILVCKSIWLQFIYLLHLIDHLTISNSSILLCFCIFSSVWGFLDLLFSFVKRLWKN